MKLHIMRNNLGLMAVCSSHYWRVEVMNPSGKRNLKCLGLAILCGLCFARPSFAQSTSFTYQGKLSDTGSLANGEHKKEQRRAGKLRRDERRQK